MTSSPPPTKKDDAVKGLSPLTIAGALIAAAGLFAIVQYFVHAGTFEANETIARRDVTQLLGQLHEYRARFNEYPSTDEGLEALEARGLTAKVPLDPWGKPYLYSNSQGRISVITFGKDGVPGGGDDIVEFHPSGAP